MENTFHLIRVLYSKGNELHLITSRFDVSAEEMDETTLEHQEILRIKRTSCSQLSVYCDDRLLLKCTGSVEYKQPSNVLTN